MKREIITLCGSTKFKKQFKEIEKKLTLDGKIVLPPAIYGKAENIIHTTKILNILYRLHLDKINISDSIYVINVDKYIGMSTSKEIKYAKKNNKHIYYYC